MHKSTLAITLLAVVTVAFADPCWTCAAGWSHWYDLGYAAPTNGDKCQCIRTPSSPSSPTSTSCWTCAPGWSHWWDLGLSNPTNGDKCQCIQSYTTTAAPTKQTSSPTTTTTQVPSTSRNCWTCSAGYKHWYDLGMEEPADKCACVAVENTVVPSSTKSVTTTTTKTPTTTTTSSPCWTCSAGWVHWYDIEGMAEPADKCACVQSGSSSTTTTQASSKTTTAAPSSRLAAFLSAMTPTSTSTGSVSFSAGIGSYSPSNPPPLTLVSQLMDNLITNTKYRAIMTYYVDSYTVGLASEKGLKVLGIIYIVPGQDNTALINTAITAAKAYPDTLHAIACGNEQGASYGLTSAVVNAVAQCTSMLRAAGVVQPIGVIDTYYSWCSNDEGNCNTPWTAVTNNVDWIGLNAYAFWNNLYSGVFPCTSPANAGAQALANHQKIQNLYGKPVVLTEFGWASAPTGSSLTLTPNYITGQQCTVANDANQKAMVQATIDLYRENKMPCNTFEAYREPWKGTSDSDVNRYWGICLGVSPYTCLNAPQ